MTPPAPAPRSTDPLAAPLTLPNGSRLANRLVKASMEEALADAGGGPSPELISVTRRFAEGGPSLLLTGHVIVDRRHRGRPGDVVLEGDAEEGPLRRWADAARAGGGQGWMQLNHCGRQTPRFVNKAPLAPSEVQAVKMLASFARPRAMSDAEVEGVVQRFGDAASAAQRAGWDGIEVHAAHGYLISQFLSPLTNLRTDRWGGAVESRARLLLEVVRIVRARTGPRFGVGVKLNSADFQRGGFDADDFARVVSMLDGEGLDVLEVSGGNYESPALFDGPRGPAAAGRGGEPSERSRAREAYFLDLAKAVRGLTTVPLLLTGGFRTRAGMEQALSEGIDLIGLARPLALEPDLPRRLLDGSTDRSSSTPVRAPARALQAMTDGAWSWMQIQRMARGRDPDPALSPTRAMLSYLVTDLGGAYRRPRSHA